MVYGSTLEKMTPDELESYLCDINEYVGALEELDRTNEEYIECLNATVRALTRQHEAKLDSLDKYGEMEKSENWFDEKHNDSEEKDTFGKWVPVSERLPERPSECVLGKWFLVQLRNGTIKDLFFNFNQDLWDETRSPVVAWMPLPEKMKVGENAK